MSRITDILDQMLEAAPALKQPRQPTGAVDNAMYGYANGVTPKYGVNILHNFSSASAAWREWVQNAIKVGYISKPEWIQMAKAQPLEFVRRLIEFHDGCFVLVINGDVQIFSRRPKAQLPREFVQRIEQHTPDLAPYSPVGWFSTMSGRPQMTTASQVLYGMEDEEAQYQAGKTAQHRASLSPGKKSDLRRQFWGPGGFDPDTAPDIVDKLLQ